MNKIINPNHSVRNSDLQQKWQQTRNYHNMISKANKPSGYSHSVSRMNYLNSKDTSKHDNLSKETNMNLPMPMLVVTDHSVEGNEDGED